MELTQKHCVPCEGGTPPFTKEQEDELIKKVSSWTLYREGIHKLKKRFSFKNFKEAIAFVNRVAEVAEEGGIIQIFVSCTTRWSVSYSPMWSVVLPRTISSWPLKSINSSCRGSSGW